MTLFTMDYLENQNYIRGTYFLMGQCDGRGWGLSEVELSSSVPSEGIMRTQLLQVFFLC